MVGGRLKGSPCLQRADEGHTIVNALGRTSYPPQPQGPPEGFRNPAQSAPESHAVGGVLMGAEARECAPKRSPARHVPRTAASSRGQPMSTEDDREKSREESPKWHRARAARLRANGFAKMAEEHEQIAEIIERRRRELPSSTSGLTREAAAVTDGGHHDRISQHVVGRRSGLLPFLNP